MLKITIIIHFAKRSLYKDMNIIKIGVEIMKLQNITFEVCPRCQSTFINQTDNENPTWQCSDCLYTFEIPLIAKFPDSENKDSVD